MSCPDQSNTTALPDRIRTDLLSSERRCRILSLLAAAGDEESVADLAVKIRAAETDQSPDSLDSETVEAIRSELYDCHLPKLTATGVVEYDSTLDKLRLTDSELSAEAARTLAE